MTEVEYIRNIPNLTGDELMNKVIEEFGCSYYNVYSIIRESVFDEIAKRLNQLEASKEIIKTLCKYPAFHEENSLVVLEVTKTDLAKAEAFLNGE